MSIPPVTLGWCGKGGLTLQKTTVVVVKICSQCFLAMLVAWDEGVHVRTDPLPIAFGAELWAIAQGRRTFAFRANELVYRSGQDLAAPPAAGRIVATHQCGQPIPTLWRDGAAVALRQAPSSDVEGPGF